MNAIAFAGFTSAGADDEGETEVAASEANDEVGEEEPDEDEGHGTEEGDDG